MLCRDSDGASVRRGLDARRLAIYPSDGKTACVPPHPRRSARFARLGNAQPIRRAPIAIFNLSPSQFR